MLLLCCTALQAQVGQAFPALPGITLTDEELTLPADKNDKYLLVGLAYSKKAEVYLDEWFSPVYEKFLASRESAGLFASFTYDIHVYFVPMFTGVKKAAEKKARKKAKENADPRLVNNILFYKGSLKEYQAALKLTDKEKPYIFLVNKEGQIVFATSGAFHPRKLMAIEAFINGLED